MLFYFSDDIYPWMVRGKDLSFWPCVILGHHKIWGFFFISWSDSDHLSFHQHLERGDSTRWFCATPRGTRKFWRQFCGHNVGVPLASAGHYPGMLLDLPQCTGRPSTTENYAAPKVSGAEIKKLWHRVEKYLEKREANKPVCLLKSGISFCLSGCCLSTESQNSVSGNQEFLMGWPSAGWSFHLPFLFILLYKPSLVRELPDFHPKFYHSEFRSQDSA